MILLKHELKQGRNLLIIWAAVIGFMLSICVLIYPQMKSQMGEISEMFADMGSFSAAFGMDKINFGEFIGYFATECGNVLGLGGAFFAALLGVSALAKEEKEHTAEFLLAHPISRIKVVLQKLISIYVQIVSLNLIVAAVAVFSIFIIGENTDFKLLGLLFFAYFILQIELASICFAISAFISRGTLGIGLGMAALLYFLNIIANLTEDVEFLKYITPFAYTEGASIITEGSIEIKYLFVGMVLAVIGIILAFYKYNNKEIAA